VIALACAAIYVVTIIRESRCLLGLHVPGFRGLRLMRNLRLSGSGRAVRSVCASVSACTTASVFRVNVRHEEEALLYISLVRSGGVEYGTMQWEEVYGSEQEVCEKLITHFPLI
jgi:hypothetical protein